MFQRLFGLYVCLLLLVTGALQAQESSLNLDELNPDRFNQDFTAYDQNTALFCAQLSNLIYADSSFVNLHIATLQKLHPDAGIKHRFIINNIEDVRPKRKQTETELVFFGTTEFVVIAFRGTWSWKDVRTDLRMRKAENLNDSLHQAFGELPAGHYGFRQSIINLIKYEDYFEQLRAFITQCSDNPHLPVYVTGHSSGAALAQLTIHPLVNKGFNFQGCYNFSPPLAVSCTTDDFLRDKYGYKTYDLVNYKDYIPRGGTSNRKHLRHFGQFYRFCKNGDLNAEHERHVRFLFPERLWPFKYIPKYHRLDTYIANLRLTSNAATEVAKRGEANDCLCFPKRYDLPSDRCRLRSRYNTDRN